MAGAGIFLLLAGYSVFYVGLDWIHGGNDGFLTLIVPGKFTATAAKDTSTSAPSINSVTNPTGPSTTTQWTTAHPVKWSQWMAWVTANPHASAAVKEAEANKIGVPLSMIGLDAGAAS